MKFEANDIYEQFENSAELAAILKIIDQAGEHLQDAKDAPNALAAQPHLNQLEARLDRLEQLLASGETHGLASQISAVLAQGLAFISSPNFQ